MSISTQDGRETGSPRKWLLVSTLLLINTYAFVDRAVLALLVEPIKRDLGASDLQMGLLLGMGFAFFYAVCAIPAGHFVDRHSRRATIGVASIFWALMTIVCGTSHSMTQLFVGRAGVGLAESFIAPAAFSLIRDAVPLRSRGLAFSLYAMAPVIGGATSLLIGGHVLALATAGSFGNLPFLSGLAPWQCTLIVTGTFGLPLSLLLLLVPEPERPPGESNEPAPAGSVVEGLGEALRHVRGNLSIYLPLVLFVTFGAMSNFANSGWVPAILGRSWGLSPQQAGPLLGTIMLPCGVGGLLFSGVMLTWLTGRGGDIRTYGTVAASGMAIGLVGIGLAPSLTFALVMVGITSFFLGNSYTVGASTLGQITPVRMMGRVTAVYFLFQSLLGQGLGPFLVAFGSQNMFGGRAALANSFAFWCGLFGIGMVSAVWLLRQRLRQGYSQQLAG